MDENGNLIAKNRNKVCEACGNVFTTKAKGVVKWCETCRPTQYKKTQKAYYHRINYGIHRQGQRQQTQESRDMYLISKINSKIIKALERRQRRKIKYFPIIEARKAGKTFREIGISFHISWQRVQQICADCL